jgi:DNA-binding NarL/FixJ family response regulator
MLKLGAMGYITKNSSKDEMVKAIIEVSMGNKYVCEEVKNILLKHEMTGDTANPDMSVLSRRELEVINLIRDGLSSKEIALKFGIALKTIEVHRYNILKKLKLKNTASLINFINEHGL